MGLETCAVCRRHCSRLGLTSALQNNPVKWPVRAQWFCQEWALYDCIQAMQQQQLLQACREFIQSGCLFLGICVGYQALFERSEEFNSCAAGLGIFQGSVVRFSQGNGLKVPQIGWNQLQIARPDCPLLRGVADGSYAYFVHSFFPQPAEASLIAGLTAFGVPPEAASAAVVTYRLFTTYLPPIPGSYATKWLIANGDL